MKNNRCSPHKGRGDPDWIYGSRGDPPIIRGARGHPIRMFTSRGDPPGQNKNRGTPLKRFALSLSKCRLNFSTIDYRNESYGRGMPENYQWSIINEKQIEH